MVKQLSEQERLEALIYKTLKEDPILNGSTGEKRMSDRAYVTDILGEAITQAGYKSPQVLVEKIAKQLYEIAADGVNSFRKEFGIEVGEPRKWKDLPDSPNKEYWREQISKILEALPELACADYYRKATGGF